MRLAIALLCLTVVFAFAGMISADDKEKTLKGVMLCGKCTLKETKECANVLQVKEGDKLVNYFLDDKGRGEPYHKAICPPDSKKDATVVGIVGEKDGKKTIKPSKVDVK